MVEIIYEPEQIEVLISISLKILLENSRDTMTTSPSLLDRFQFNCDTVYERKTMLI